MSEIVNETTEYGFRFGAAEVTRATAGPRGEVVIQLGTKHLGPIDIYVTPKGRSIKLVHDHEVVWEAGQ